MCTDSLVGSLSPWNAISNKSSMSKDYEIGRDELGTELRSYKTFISFKVMFITFSKFLVTVSNVGSK